jgi:arginase
MVASGKYSVTLVGAPAEHGVNVAGSALGPSALRTIGLAGALGRLGRHVSDYGDLMPAAAADRRLKAQ